MCGRSHSWQIKELKAKLGDDVGAAASFSTAKEHQAASGVEPAAAAAQGSSESDSSEVLRCPSSILAWCSSISPPSIDHSGESSDNSLRTSMSPCRALRWPPPVYPAAISTRQSSCAPLPAPATSAGPAALPSSSLRPYVCLIRCARRGRSRFWKGKSMRLVWDTDTLMDRFSTNRCI
ncbi:uncharacterized protein [Lolium perenne]|uniref:uncharacterized protein n=1 Tax=Lolium perenne TaxID=4522 RepID=UPI0021F50F3E|nr:uncharacterized protein LOC127305721 [Lolium perenne]